MNTIPRRRFLKHAAAAGCLSGRLAAASGRIAIITGPPNGISSSSLSAGRPASCDVPWKRKATHLKLVNISVVFGMVVMPLTYYPIMRVAMDRQIMRRHVNSRTDTALGVLFLLLITLAAFAAIPLMILTDSGQP
ncbi:MAG TPA: hypothetical protein VLX11_16390 [Candidatus Acidoferrales bacterium]|nr:hypothetical protein [Candidatus Acidoferrales bacterium]